MNERIEQVAESLVAVSDNSPRSEQELPGNLQDGYRYFLSRCDGGYTKDHFWHFFGQSGPNLHNLVEWNSNDLWKKYYGLDEKTFVFAEDIFGTQFCFDVRGNRRVVKMLLPDGGKISLSANTFEEFLELEVLGQAHNLHVRRLAHMFFQSSSQAFRLFSHISCKIPATLGGNDSDLGNLELMRSSTHLKILGQIASQIKNLPSGTRIRDVRIDEAREEITLLPDSGK